MANKRDNMGAAHPARASAAHAHHHAADARGVRCGVLTVSDSRTLATDDSGNRVVQLLEGAGHQVVRRLVLPDDLRVIRHTVLQAAESDDIDALVLTGGTGVSPRDVTIDAIEPLFRKRLPGFGEVFRMLSFDAVGAVALLSQATAGVVARSVVFSLPGSSQACDLGVSRLILPILGHAVGLLRPKP